MRLIDADSYVYPGDLIDEPTIDAEPVVHGHWESGDKVDYGDGFKPVLRCSVCGQLTIYIPEFKITYPRYCQCGAKMDL